MINEVEGPLNFNAFLQLFGSKLHGTDDEEMVLEAFKLFDSNGVGMISKDT
jgi:Ca2+-binding EF-hand superfamily protein